MAEYIGVIFGLKSSYNLGIKQILVFSDSELLVRQVRGEYQVKNDALKVYHQEVKSLVGLFDSLSLEHIAREANTRADQLAIAARDVGNRGGSTKKRGRPSSRQPPTNTSKQPPNDEVGNMEVESNSSSKPISGAGQSKMVDFFQPQDKKGATSDVSLSNDKALEEAKEVITEISL